MSPKPTIFKQCSEFLDEKTEALDFVRGNQEQKQRFLRRDR